jgi:flagellar biogenesis protein FliO
VRSPTTPSAAGTTLSPGLPLRRDGDDAPAAALAVAALAIAFAAFAVVRFLSRRGRGAFAWDWRRALGGVAANETLRVVAVARLDGRARVYVLEWEGARLLVAHSDRAVTLLSEHAGPNDASTPP